MARKRNAAEGVGDPAPLLSPGRLVLRFGTTLSSRGDINRVADDLVSLVRREGYRGDALTDLSIALREALANAIIHGNGDDPRKKAQLRCYADPGKGILISIRDEGSGFDPGTVPDPTGAQRMHRSRGRGIFLMRELMDRVEHRMGGREVLLYKKLAPSPGDGDRREPR